MKDYTTDPVQMGVEIDLEMIEELTGLKDSKAENFLAHLHRQSFTRTQEALAETVERGVEYYFRHWQLKPELHGEPENDSYNDGNGEGEIIVFVRGGVAECDDARVKIVDYDNEAIGE